MPITNVDVQWRRQVDPSDPWYRLSHVKQNKQQISAQMTHNKLHNRYYIFINWTHIVLTGSSYWFHNT